MRLQQNNTLIDYIGFGLGIVFILLFVICVIFFFWGIVGYVIGKKRNDQMLTNISKKRFVKGLVGGILVLIFFVVANFVIQILGVGNGTIEDPLIPRFEPTPTSLFNE